MNDKTSRRTTSTMTAILGRLATCFGMSVKWDEAVASQKRIVSGYKSWWVQEAPIQPLVDGGYEIAMPEISMVF